MPYLKSFGFNTGHCLAPHLATQKGAGINIIKHPNISVVLEHPNEGLIVFDTGYDQAFFDACRSWPERFYPLFVPVLHKPHQALVVQMKSRGLDPKDVSHVVISHFHGDHVAGLHHFPEAVLHCSKAGFDQLMTLGRFGRVRRGLLKGLIPPQMANRARFFEEAKTLKLNSDLNPFVDGNDILGDGSLLAVNLPGHCPGHYGIVIKDDAIGDHFLIADAAWSSHAIETLVPPPYLTAQALGNAEIGIQTLMNLKALKNRNSSITLTPCHCPRRHDEWVKKLGPLA